MPEWIRVARPIRRPAAQAWRRRSAQRRQAQDKSIGGSRKPRQQLALLIVIGRPGRDYDDRGYVVQALGKAHEKSQRRAI